MLLNLNWFDLMYLCPWGEPSRFTVISIVTIWQFRPNEKNFLIEKNNTAIVWYITMLYGHADVNQHILAANRMTVNKFASIVLAQCGTAFNKSYHKGDTSSCSNTSHECKNVSGSRKWSSQEYPLRHDADADADANADAKRRRHRWWWRNKNKRDKKRTRNRNRLVVKSIEKRAHKIAPHSGKVSDLN